MPTSILIARLIGPILVVVGLAGLINSKLLQDLGREALASRSLIFFAGILALLAGLAVVNTHNVWSSGWPVLITLFGWLAIAGGILRIGFPGLTKSLAQEVATRGITVNCVAPGFIETAMTDALADQQKEKLLGAIPVGRLGSPDDVAACVYFLASEEAAYVTGQTLHVNGGMAMI